MTTDPLVPGMKNVRPDHAPRRPRRRPVRIPRWVRIAVSLIVLAVTVWLVVIPQFGDARDAITSLEHVALPLVLLAVVLELASMAAYSALTRVILAKSNPSYFTLLRIDVTDVGVNHVVPGGGTTSGALRLRLFHRVGIGAARGFTTATIQITGSNLVLGLIFGVGVAISISSFAGNVMYLIAAIAVVVLLAAAVGSVWLLVSSTDLAVRWIRALVGRVPLVRPARAEAFVRAMALQTRELGTDRRRVFAALALAVGNWLLDAAALWILFTAFGYPLALGTLLTVYGLGGILAQLPLTPGGLGIVEGVMVPAFVAFGLPPSVAVVGVIGWRLLEFWMPIPLSALAYLSLRLGPLRHQNQPAGPLALGPKARKRVNG